MPCSLRRAALTTIFVGLLLSSGCGSSDDDPGPAPTAVCGDGVVAAGEGCDDGNTVSDDGCSASCAIENGRGECGDGSLEEGEECDDGNTVSGDGCSAACLEEVTAPACGDSVVDEGEECDDGNLEPGDGCEPNCAVTQEEVLCEQLAPLPSGDTCEVSPGGDELLLQGDVLTAYTIYRGGYVLVDNAGVIQCTGCDCAAAGATTVTCPTGVISPGLINAHDHITYAHNDPYTDTGERYEHRHDWRRGLNGHTELDYLSGASTDQVRWGELRFMVGGATSTIGSGSATGFLRNLDREHQEGLGQQPVDYSTFPLGDSSGAQLASGCGYPNMETQQDIASEDAYFPHIAEGIDAFARNEFRCVSGSASDGEDLLEPQSAFIHSVALTPIDYARMADQGTNLVWSPRSNVTLYGDTAQVTSADALGVKIALGTDWMPTGSMNLQRELVCADYLNQNHYEGHFSDRELWWMVTLHAAQSAAVDDAVGELRAGLVADIAIFDGALHADHRAVIDAEPQDTVLVLRGGMAMYGDDALVSALPGGGTCDSLDVCGSSKRVCASGDIGKSFSDLQASAGALYPLFFCGAEPSDEPSCKPARSTSVNGSSVYSGDATIDDPDGDGIPSDSDNCLAVFNPLRPVDDGVQADFDLDGVGDACDECPMHQGAPPCPAFDPLDIDGDGFENGSDNCVEVYNPGQDDGDNDQKGDLCDLCPATSNPGADACPVSIYAIKSGQAQGQVAVEDALVTGCADSSGFFVQVKPGDPGYSGADHSGVYVYYPSVSCGVNVSVGDRVTVNPATVSVFFDQIQLTNATVNVVSSLSEALPAPVDVTPAQVGTVTPSELEGVIVRVKDVLVTEVEPAPGPGDSAPTHEFVVDGVLRVNDFLYAVNPLPAVNSPYAELTGILDYRNGAQKLEPRGPADLAEGPPLLVGFGPEPAFVREGETNVQTIPVPIEVTLSGPAQSNTLVSVTSATPASLAVQNDSVLIPMGATSAPVFLDGVAQDAGVQLTASLDSVMLDATVRVVGVGEQPQVVAINPLSVNVAPFGSVPLEVFFDIPAQSPNGNDVTLSLSPNTFGSVPSFVNVPADQLSQSFFFTAGGATGSETITATFGGSMATASAHVTLGGGLVINEVDYDNVGTDDSEFIEIYNATSGPISLSGKALVLVNGNDDLEYDRIDLGPAGTLNAGEFLVIGSSTLLASVPSGAKTLAFSSATNNIQNGAPDALGILDVAGGTLIDALSYEGSVTMGNVMGAGLLDFVEGAATSTADDNSTVRSLIRHPDGTDSDDAMSDWLTTTTLSPGAANVP